MLVVFAACLAYVDHYNRLPCITEPFVAEEQCFDDFCTDREAFENCRTANTFCDNGTFVANIDECVNQFGECF